MPFPPSTAPAIPRLAGAFLALGDTDPEPRADAGPSPVMLLSAIVAALVLALSAPLAWAAAPGPKASHQPAATPASKAAVPAPDDDADAGA
jgi:hypothetical protein